MVNVNSERQYASEGSARDTIAAEPLLKVTSKSDDVTSSSSSEVRFVYPIYLGYWIILRWSTLTLL